MKDYFTARAILVNKFVIRYFPTVLFGILFLAFIALVYKGWIGIDPDFGWRLRSGFLILSEGIQRKDPFSYTMPSFPWVDHAWPITLFISFTYLSLGKMGLSVIFSLVALLSLLLLLSFEESFGYLNKVVYKESGGKLGFVRSFPVLLAMANVFPFFGIRAQVVTWLIFSVFLVFIYSEKIWKKWRLLLPVLFLAWGNLHGGFFAGVSALAIFVLFKSIRKRRVDIVDVMVLVVSVLVTLINAYGVGTWREVFSSLLDTKLRWRIIEWRPALFTFDLSFVTLHTLAFVLIFKMRKSFKLEEKALYLFFLTQGVSSVRNIPLLMLVEMPLLARAIKEFYLSIKDRKGAIRRFRNVYMVAWWMGLFVLLSQILFAISGARGLSEDNYYPAQAISFIRKEGVEGRLMSKYAWGGYLIWKLPEKKVFIDGRMPSWRRNANLEKETNDAMQEYTAVINGEVSREEVFEKYNIHAVLWFSKREEKWFDALDKKLDNLLVGFGRKEKKYDFIQELEDDGWGKIYEDSVAVLYVTPS